MKKRCHMKLKAIKIILQINMMYLFFFLGFGTVFLGCTFEWRRNFIPPDLTNLLFIPAFSLLIYLSTTVRMLNDHDSLIDNFLSSFSRAGTVFYHGKRYSIHTQGDSVIIGEDGELGTGILVLLWFKNLILTPIFLCLMIIQIAAIILSKKVAEKYIYYYKGSFWPGKIIVILWLILLSLSSVGYLINLNSYSRHSFENNVSVYISDINRSSNNIYFNLHFSFKSDDCKSVELNLIMEDDNGYSVNAYTGNYGVSLDENGVWRSYISKRFNDDFDMIDLNNIKVKIEIFKIKYKSTRLDYGYVDYLIVYVDEFK